MSTLPVRYTNNHHVASTKTASPIVVAVNKAAVAGCAQSAYHRHHQQKQFLQHQQQRHQHHHHATPPVKRHPTKMAAARRAKSRSRSRQAAMPSGGSPEKRRTGNKGGCGNKKKKPLPQLMLQQNVVAQEGTSTSSSSVGEQQQGPLTAQNMVLDVVKATLNGSGAGCATATNNTSGGGQAMTTMDGLVAEWTTTVGGDVLRTPDAAACEGQDELQQQQHQQQEDIVTDNEKVIAEHLHHHQQHQIKQHNNDHLMDTSEAMDDDGASTSASSSPVAVTAGVSPVAVSVATMTGDAAVEVIPAPRRSNEELFAELQEALALEPKYQPMLYLPQSSQDGEITIGARDGAAHVLRCLKVWYELPTDVLFAAINLVDRFLAKMKVRPKHLACISVGSLYLAAEQLLGSKMNTEDLALISQCRCTAGDLERMAGIIANKLGVQPGTAPATALSFIRLFYHLFRNAAYELGLDEFYEKSISLAELEQRLEVLACDANCSSIRASELALVLICTQMDSHASGVVNQQISGLVDYAIEVQKLARIPDQTFFQSHAAVVSILARYNSSQHKMPYKQRLVWKLSSRTMRVLRPSNKMTSYLPTIDEHNQSSFDSFSRFRTGSLSSEDDEDWPTSPVVPIYEELC